MPGTNGAGSVSRIVSCPFTRMEQTIPKSKHVAWRWLGAVVGPFALLSGYCVLKHSLLLPIELDYIAPVIFALLGVAMIATLPSQPSARIVLAGVYVPLVSLALFVYGFIFYGLVYQISP
jgi:uncharacterized membrane protein